MKKTGKGLLILILGGVVICLTLSAFLYRKSLKRARRKKSRIKAKKREKYDDLEQKTNGIINKEKLERNAYHILTKFEVPIHRISTVRLYCKIWDKN